MHRTVHFSTAVTVLFALLGSLTAFSSPVKADSGIFYVTFSKISQVQRVSQNDRVELQLRTPSDQQATTSGVNWPPDNNLIPAQLTVLRLSYLSYWETPEHADRALDSCTQLALLAQAKPDTYQLSVIVQVADTSGPSSEYSEGKVIAYVGLTGYHLGCNLISLE